MIPRTCVILAAVFLLTAANVHADLIIDQFDGPAAGQSLVVTNKTPDPHDSQADGSALGGYRDIQLTRVSGQPIYVDVFGDPEDNGLFFTQGTGQAIATVTWYGADSSNGPIYALNKDLTSGGDDRFLLTVADVTGQGINVSMTVYTEDSSHVIHSSTTVPLLVTAPGVISLPYYTAFSGTADFTKIDGIALELDGTGLAGSDIAIASLSAATPEPSTLVLAAIGSMVFLGVGRKWRRA
jgi:hypothetical protein